MISLLCWHPHLEGISSCTFFPSGLNVVLPKQSQAVPPQSVDLTFSRETSGRGSTCRAPAHTPAHAPGPFTWPSYLGMGKPPSSPAPPWGWRTQPLGQRAKPAAAQMGERVENQTQVPSPPQLRAEGWGQMWAALLGHPLLWHLSNKCLFLTRVRIRLI